MNQILSIYSGSDRCWTFNVSDLGETVKCKADGRLVVELRQEIKSENVPFLGEACSVVFGMFTFKDLEFYSLSSGCFTESMWISYLTFIPAARHNEFYQ